MNFISKNYPIKIAFLLVPHRTNSNIASNKYHSYGSDEGKR